MIRGTVKTLVLPRVRDGSLRTTEAQRRAVHALVEEEPSARGPAFLQVGEAKNSNEILEMLRQLRREFNKELAELTEDYQNENHELEMTHNNDANQKKAHEDSIAMNEEIE